jgi:hypothetical protein
MSKGSVEREPETRPVEDSVAKVNNEIAVGSDLRFQRKWERWERVIWILLLVFLIASFAGLFGRGPLANAKKEAPDHSLTIKYERFQRFSTPSVLDIVLDSSAIRNGQFQIWVSEALTKPLGTQRIVPQPLDSQIGLGGILYTFPVSRIPASIEFQTQPSALGSTELKMQVPGHAPVNLKIFVYP